MKIKESFLESKTGKGNDCEDAIFVNADFVAIIDGATAKGGTLWGKDKVKSGMHAKNILFEALACMPKKISGEQAINYLDEILKEAYKENIEAMNNPKEQLEASIIIFSKSKKEIWAYGDCLCRINGKTVSHEKIIDLINSQARAAYNNMLIKNGTSLDEISSRDPGRQIIMPLLGVQAVFANSDGEYGYPVLDGRGTNAKLLKKHKVKNGDSIILASDGYFELFDTLEMTEHNLRETIKSDPLLINAYKTTKGVVPGNVSFDDRSFISFLVE